MMKTTASIWCENMLIYLSLDIIIVFSLRFSPFKDHRAEAKMSRSKDFSKQVFPQLQQSRLRLF